MPQYSRHSLPCFHCGETVKFLASPPTHWGRDSLPLTLGLVKNGGASFAQLGEPTFVTTMDCGVSLISEGPTGAWVKAEQASGRLHLITMSAKDQPVNAHVFMDQMWLHKDKTWPWTALGPFQEWGKELPRVRICICVCWRRNLTHVIGAVPHQAQMGGRLWNTNKYPG